MRRLHARGRGRACFSCGLLTAETSSNRDERPSAHAPVRSRVPPLLDGSPSCPTQQIPTAIPLAPLCLGYSGPAESHPHCALLRQWLLIRRSFCQIAIPLSANLLRRLRFPANPQASDAPLPKEPRVAPHTPRACAAGVARSGPG